MTRKSQTISLARTAGSEEQIQSFCRTTTFLSVYVLHVLQVSILIYGFLCLILGHWSKFPQHENCYEDLIDCTTQWFFTFMVIYECYVIIEFVWNLTAYSHRFDIVPETLTYDFGLAEPARYKRKKKTKHNRNYIYISHMDHERVITNDEIKLNGLPSWLMNLTHGKLRDLVNNLHVYSKNYDGETPEETFRMASYRDWETDRKSTRLNSSHLKLSRMPSSA